MRRRKLHASEHQEAVALMQAVEAHLGRWPELGLLYAIPNGGHRHPATAAKLKAEGVKAGIPDYCLPVARLGYHGLYIELKAKNGRLSPEQDGWITALACQGYRARVCVGWEEAWAVIKDYLNGVFP